MDFRIVPVKVLLEKLVSNEFMDNILFTKLDVSLLTKIEKTLVQVKVMLCDNAWEQIATNCPVDHMLLYAANEVESMLDEINTEMLRCKEEAEYQTLTPATSEVMNLPSSFRWLHLMKKLRRLIEILKVMSSRKQVGKLCVSNSNSDWDETSIQLPSLSTSVKGLLDKIVSTEVVENFQTTKLDVSLLKTLVAALVKIGLLIPNEAVERYSVGLWLDLLRNAIFEVGYLFDQINREVLRCIVEAEYDTLAPSQISENPSSPFKLFNGLICSKLQKLNKKLEFFSSRAISLFAKREFEILEARSSGEQLRFNSNRDWVETYSYFFFEEDCDETSIKLGSISPYMKGLLDKIASSEFVENFQITKLDVSLLKTLEATLVRVLRHRDYDVKIDLLVRHNAEEILIVGIWLDMLRDAVFEVGYVFDQINREALRCKVEAEYDTLTSSSPFKLFNGLIYSKLQKLNQKLEFFSSRVVSLFAKREFDGFSSKSVWQETPTCSILDDETSIYGRDSDTKKLKHLLLSSHGDDSKIGIISIVGMEGIGKTTLAKLLYNDPEVKDKFELKLWAHVSEDLEDESVLETILDNVNTNRDDVNNIYPKFLLVLDEVCDAGSINWTLLMNISNVRQTGSRIIITTPDEKVALSIQNFALSMQNFLSVHYMTPLENEDCWSILAKHAFGACNDQNQSNLEEIGKEIAKKCYGSPFATVALGDILRTKLSPDNWNYVLESDICVFTDHDVQPFIQLRYHSLPTPLKRCFAYCSIFPKKSIIGKKSVVQLWIAEGLVESSSDQKKVGEEYFDVLVSRSLIHRRSIGDGEANFEMHNLVHDLATEVSSPYCINMDEHNLHAGVHNLSYNRGIYDSYNKFDKLYGLKDLHTFLALPLQEQLPLCLLSNKVLHDLLPTMKQLRVLSLSNYKSITEVPNSIGNLLYLRYLNLSHTKIERLPSETCKLYNLQFLLLSGCKRLTELPEDMGKLVNLCHLDISETALREMPVQIANLENLQSLSDFVVSKHTHGLKVGELGKYPHLHGKLSISQLQNVNDPFEAVQINMKMKDQIDELSLEWECGSTCSDSQIQSLVLEHLRPSTNLKSLTIKGYRGINFPNWLGDSLFSNMVYLRISDCDDCLWLPPLGQLGNLKELIIEGMKSLQIIGIEFYGSDSSSSFQPFPSLETLHFENMQEWEEWNLIGGMDKEFPCLKTLSLSKCPKLRLGNIPYKFSSLREPKLRECPLLVQSMPSSNHLFRELVMFPLNSLQQLTIDGFPSPISFSTDSLPNTLKILIVSNCENLVFLPDVHFYIFTSLEELKISYSCNSMISFTLGALPVLKTLFIEGCKNLKSILTAEDASEKSLTFLRSIKIWDCNELESFPLGGLPTPNLVHIAVWKCAKLNSLPEAMNTLTGLQEMEIDNLPNLQSFVIDDLPISLQELTVGSVGGILWNTVPTWKHLPFLSVLRINSNDTVNTLMVPLLPASLVTLCICGHNGSSIDGKWLQHLTSLQNLEIVNAPKLKSLPKKGLPSSLSVLSITCCPLLDTSLRRKRGKEWRKISHIQSIIIDDELIT